MPTTERFRFFALSAANFFSRYHFYLIVFVISTFLAGFIGSSNAEFAVAGANVGATAALALAPEVFSRFGTRRVLALLGCIEIAVLLALAVVHSAALVILLIIIMTSITFSMFLGLDILVEAITTDESQTGSVRGVFLTATNTSTLIATLSLAAILTDNNYSGVFLAAALVLVPFIMLALRAFPSVSSAALSRHVSVQHAIAGIVRIPPVLVPVIESHFLLQLGYAWVNFYVPLYLFRYDGFSWHTIALILALSIVPFLVLEMPLGWMADRWFGEKRILLGGIVVLAISTAGFAFAGVSVAAWIVFLMLNAAGSATVEIMTESAFFKRVTDADGETISLLRILRPLASIAGPAIAGALLLFVPPDAIFLIFGALLALGIPAALRMADTRPANPKKPLGA